MAIQDKGLKIVNADMKATRHARSAHEGLTYQHEYFQPMPFFFTREGNTIPIMGIWRGGIAFLICGGPSFNELDTSKLDLCYTMAINNSIKSYRTDAWISIDDPGRFLASAWMSEKIMKFTPFDHAEKALWDSRVINGQERWQPLGLKVGDCPNVYYFRRNEKFHAPRWLWEHTLNWGNSKKHGGSRTVMLPALRILFLLGFRVVYLLGCDLDMTEDKGYHFDEDRNKGAIKGNNSTYERMKKDYFPKLRKEFDKYNFHVYNCNSNSKLDVFDYVSYDQAIEHATSKFGDVKLERSKGMYKTFDQKVQELNTKQSAG